MSDLDKVIHIASAARGAYNAFSEAVGEEGEVVREGRKISYKATGSFYRWELYYHVVATDEQTGCEESASGRKKDRTIEEAISKVLKAATEFSKSGPSSEQDCSSDTGQDTQLPSEGSSTAATATAAATKSPPPKVCTLDRLIDYGSRALKHLGRIADSMSQWEGKIAEELDLTPSDVAAIKKKHPNELKLQARAALMHWKQSKGPDATYNNLIRVFEIAGYREYAETVRSVLSIQVRSGPVLEEAAPPPSTASGTEGASTDVSVDQKCRSASISIGLVFSEDMSDTDFVAYLKNEGVREKDYTSLIDNGVVAKVFLNLTEDDIENKELNITFGGKKILKKLLKQLNNGAVTDYQRSN